MSIPSFVKQDTDPLYPKILWNRPVSRSGAARILLPGGHSGDFSLPTAIHQLAYAAGAGECTVVLPDSLLKLLGGTPSTTFVEASPSGSLGTEALGRILELAEENDILLLGASLSNNSHTSILIERICSETATPTVLFGEALTALQHHSELILDNPNNLVIFTMPELFALANRLNLPISIRKDGGLINKLEIIEEISRKAKSTIVVYGSEIIISSDTSHIVTPVNYHLAQLPAAVIAVLAVFWGQNPSKPIEGLATGAYVLREASGSTASAESLSVRQIETQIRSVLEGNEDSAI